MVEARGTTGDAEAPAQLALRIAGAQLQAQAEEPIDRALAEPPDGAFADGRALALAAPDKDLARVVTAHVSKPRGPRTSGGWNWASEAGDPCLRRLAYSRLYPERALPDGEELAFTFRRGRYIERECLDELRDAGYQIVEEDRPFDDKRLKVRGRIDGKVVLYKDDRHAHRPPIEIKGYAPGVWKQINSARDFVDSDLPYLRRVPAQITWYMILDPGEGDEGILYIKNKLSGVPKEIVVPLDQKYALWLWRRVRVLNDYVRRRKLPPRIEYDERICGRCPFRADCLKDIPAGPSPSVLDHEKAAELHELLQERERLDPARKSYEELDKRLSALVKGIPKLIVGDYMVTGQEVEMPASARKAYTYWRKSVVKFGATKPEEA